MAFSAAKAFNYANDLVQLDRFDEVKSLVRRQIPVAQRILGNNDIITLTLRSIYAQSLFFSAAATLDELREAVTMLEDTERTARRVLGGEHPIASVIEGNLQDAQETLRAREAATA